MINVCANYMGTVILLDSFNTKDKADEFMSHDYILHYANEIEDAEEDEVIHPDEMFIEDDVPFFNMPLNNIKAEFDLDELPF